MKISEFLSGARCSKRGRISVLCIPGSRQIELKLRRMVIFLEIKLFLKCL
eukprot:UN27298